MVTITLKLIYHILITNSHKNCTENNSSHTYFLKKKYAEYYAAVPSFPAYLNPEFQFHDLIQFRYMYPKYFDYEQYLQLDLLKQGKVTTRHSKCGITLKSPPVYVPIKLFTKSVLLPTEEKLETQASFTFIAPFAAEPYTKAWDKTSLSWVSSTITFINCTSNNKICLWMHYE